MNMHKLIGAFAGLLLAASLSGCSNLTVTVDVLDPAHVRDEMFGERLHKAYAQVVRAQPGELKAQMARRYEDFSAQVLVLLDKMDTVAALLDDKSLASSVRNLRDALAPDRKWHRDMEASGDALERIASATRQTGAQLKYRPRDPMALPLRAQLEALDAELAKEARRRDATLRIVEASLDQAVERAAAQAREAAANNVCQSTPGKACTVEQRNDAMVAGDKAAAEKRRALKGTSALAQAQAAVVEASASAELRSIIGDGSLASTEYAYTVASAPDHLWRRDFNRAYASGLMGSSDMVIRLNSTADFSVKGMLFDASTVASVASKVTTQALLLGVQMAGVPVPTPRTTSPTNGGDALSTASSALATADATLAQRRAVAAAQKEAIRALAQSLLSVSPALQNELKDKDGADDKRKALHSSIDASVAALRSLLAMDGLQ